MEISTSCPLSTTQVSWNMFRKPLDRSPSFYPSNVLAPASARKFINAVGELSRFPTEAASPGRQAACAGVRAFLHRMVACIMPSPSPSPGESGNTSSSNSVTSDMLLAALVDAVPQLVKPLRSSTTNACYNGGGSHQLSSDIMTVDAEQRWKEIRDVIPLVTQVLLRFKVCDIRDYFF
ncbi:unnamed protein product [Trichobilharzia regenti]|nr:unnamed protein product [Trichobilharzia regenti]